MAALDGHRARLLLWEEEEEEEEEEENQTPVLVPGQLLLMTPHRSVDSVFGVWVFPEEDRFWMLSPAWFFSGYLNRRQPSVVLRLLVPGSHLFDAGFA